MNRLVIVGNGFDLAHGLPTSYRDFIDDYWGSLKNGSHEDNLIKLDLFSFMDVGGVKSYDEFIKKIKKDVEKKHAYEISFNKNQVVVTNLEWGYDSPSYHCVLEFNNIFFKLISENRTIQNWVDIENEYYKLLKLSLKENDNAAIVALNKQFLEVKSLLEKYLIKKVEEGYVFSEESVDEFVDIFQENIIYKLGSNLDTFYKELPKKDVEIFKKRLIDSYLVSEDKKTLRVVNHFLSFNYTTTVSQYLKLLDLDLECLNEIHGSLSDKKNPINFGFGDEMDKHYQEIEEKDDNEYLRNIKSFQYLHTSNYKRLLDLVDSDKFQVYIMGHSCGLSDRTLLNTIFEHENCLSIKVFYHQRDDGSDNYTEITQNISRHFNKKKLMREKIVNKTLCQPLPQIKLPKKN